MKSEVAGLRGLGVSVWVAQRNRETARPRDRETHP